MEQDETKLLEFIKHVLQEKTFDIKNAVPSDLEQSDINSFEQKNDLSLQDKLNKLQAEVEKKATKIVCGTSRCAYRLSSKKVLKVALNAAGISQNKQEAKFFGEHPNLQKHLAKVYDSDKKNGLWIISELTNPLFLDERSYKFWEEKTGFDFDILEYYYIQLLVKHIKPEQVLKTIVDFNLNKNISDEEKQQLQKQVIKQHFYALKFINDVIKPISSVPGIGVGDIVSQEKIDSWGATADGKIVLLDYGLTDDIYDYFYRKN